MNCNETIGERIARLRSGKNIKQSELAEKLGISAWFMRKYEKAKSRKELPDEVIKEIASILEQSVEYVIHGNSIYERRLKPCPFCGHKAEIDGFSLCYIRCSNTDGGCNAHVGYYDTIEEAVDNWNNRVTAPVERPVKCQDCIYYEGFAECQLLGNNCGGRDFYCAYGSIEANEEIMAVPDEILNMDIWNLNLNIRAVNSLARAGLETVSDVIRRYNEDKLTGIRNFGAVCLKETLRMFDEMGISLDGCPLPEKGA